MGGFSPHPQLEPVETTINTVRLDSSFLHSQSVPENENSVVIHSHADSMSGEGL